jgi:antitoxin CptB
MGAPLMDPEIGKLRWRCRRGMKELDVLLSRYLEEEYREATPEHKQAFRQLLDSQDPLLYAYFLGHEPPPDAVLSSLLERITVGRTNDR